jgi:hypothetical protein
VSEERGTVSIARDGVLRKLRRPQNLAAELQTSEPVEARAWWRERAGLDAVLAAAGAIALWAVFVPGSALTEVTVPARVRVSNLPSDLEIEAIEPTEVSVTLRGLRRDLLLSEPDQVAVRVDAYLARLGRRTFSLEEDAVRRPDTLDVVSIDPDKIKLSLRPIGGEPAPEPAP